MIQEIKNETQQVERLVLTDVSAVTSNKIEDIFDVVLDDNIKRYLPIHSTTHWRYIKTVIEWILNNTDFRLLNICHDDARMIIYFIK